MTAIVMDGRALAREIEERMKLEAGVLKDAGVEPTLATILVGDDPASAVYVSMKHRAARRVGIVSQSHTLPASATTEEVSSLIQRLNSDPKVDGILLQLPLPPQIDEREMIERISPEKDVDGLTSANSGKLFYGNSGLVPCTPRGVMELLHKYAIKVASSNVVVINRSALVGMPLYHLFLAEDATVTNCHSKSRDLKTLTIGADILVTAVGRRPDFVVTSDMVKAGAVVIDVAMNRVGEKLVGDVDFEEVSKKASYITPVPGGVGPMTVTMLLRNTLRAASGRSRPVLVEAAPS